MICACSGDLPRALIEITFDRCGLEMYTLRSRLCTAFSRGLIRSLGITIDFAQPTAPEAAEATVRSTEPPPPSPAGPSSTISGPNSSTTFSIMDRHRSTSRIEFSSLSRDSFSAIVFPVVTVGSRVTLSRPTRTKRSTSD